MSVPDNWLWREEPLSGGRTVVFDIDGVLANADDRQHLITGSRRDWKNFFGACGDDAPIEETHRLLELLSPETVVVLLTGRPVEVQQLTVDWFDRHGLRWDLLIMRNKGDYDAALIFKQQTVRKLKQLGFELRLAFEDDADNHQMFQDEGVPCIYMHSGYYETRDAMRKQQEA